MARATAIRIDIERVREVTLARANGVDALDFRLAAIEQGATEEEADRIDEALTVRIMRAAGAL